MELTKSPPIFVVGPPRSGTTLTAKILGRHSRIFMPGETHFFDDIYARRQELGELRDAEASRKVFARLKTLYGRYNEQPDQDRVEELLGRPDAIRELIACRSYVQLFSCFMEIQMRFAGKVRWGNNVPKDIFHIEEILSFYPGAKILICIRDVRDFLLSYRNKWRVTSDSDVERIKSLYHPVLTSLLWNASVKQIGRIESTVPRENLMILRYEDLVERTESVVREICRFIGEQFEPDMLNVQDQNSSFTVAQKGIYSLSVARWRRLLSTEEAYIAQQLTKGRLQKFGYAAENLTINPLKIGWLWATVPYALWRALQANKNLRGPLLPYVAKRVAALCHAPSFR